jgi:hypothetical protein
MKKDLFFKLLICLLFFTAITGCKRGQKFDREKWQYGDGISYPLRDNLLDDLLANHKLKGLTYYQALQLLGMPQDTAKLKISYEIINTRLNYNPKHKPTYIKNLILYFSKDSTVVKTEVYEHTDKDMRKKKD